jgi:flavin-dependent dehydrogenase
METVSMSYAARAHRSEGREAIQKTGGTPAWEVIETPGPSDAYFIYDDAITDWYGWVIPKGTRTDVGIAADARRGGVPFERFKSRVDAVMGLHGTGVRRAALLTRLHSQREIHLGEGRILLAGEAAGLVSPSSGEGISYALRSALLAAAAFERQPTDPLASYREAAAPLLERLSLKLAKASALRARSDRLGPFGAAAAPS